MDVIQPLDMTKFDFEENWKSKLVAFLTVQDPNEKWYTALWHYFNSRSLHMGKSVDWDQDVIQQVVWQKLKVKYSENQY